jgi:hypothetical protein
MNRPKSQNLSIQKDWDAGLLGIDSDHYPYVIEHLQALRENL